MITVGTVKMKFRQLTAVCFCAAVLLGGCKEHSFLKGTAEAPPVETHSFLGELADEYQVLADYAAANENSTKLAAEFYDKARRAAGGEDLPPEPIQNYDIPGFAIHDLTQARHNLVDALARVNVPENSKMLAMAQVKFDCWLAYQPYQKREGAYIGCRESFRQAMAHVDFSKQVAKAKSPPVLKGPQVIHFADESMTLNQESHDKIAALAEQALSIEGTVVLLIGHSKTKAAIEDTSNNAVRRIIAVRNALYQGGVDPDLVRTEIVRDGSPLDVEVELHPGAV